MNIRLSTSQGRSQRGTSGTRGPAPPPDKVLARPVGPGRYIGIVQNNKFSNKNTLVHFKNSLTSGGFAPGFLFIYIYRYIKIYIYIYIYIKYILYIYKTWNKFYIDNLFQFYIKGFNNFYFLTCYGFVIKICSSFRIKN